MRTRAEERLIDFFLPAIDIAAEEMLKSGRPPTFDIGEKAHELWIRRHRGLLPTGQEAVVLRGYANQITSYGQLTVWTARALAMAGVPVYVLPIDVPDEALPAAFVEACVKHVAKHRWELLIAQPQLHPTDKKATVYFTMWECCRPQEIALEVLNKAKAVIVPSEWCAVVFNAAGVALPFHVVPLPVDCELFSPGPPPDIATFGVVGDARPRKNIALVYDSFMRAFKGVHDVKLLVKVHADDCLPYISPDPRVEVVAAEYSDQQMAEWYRRLTAYVSGSRCEGFGLTGLQALACGRPVIQTQAHGHAAYFDKSVGYPLRYSLQYAAPALNSHPYLDGLWYDPDGDSLIEAMRRVYEIRPEALRKGRAGRRRALDFSLDKYGVRLKETLEQIGFLAGKDEKTIRVEVIRREPSVEKSGGQFHVRLNNWAWLRHRPSDVTGKWSVIGPQPTACGVGQYGRALSHVIGYRYVPYQAVSHLTETVIVQYHPFYWHNEDIVDYVGMVCAERAAILDIHHTDRLWMMEDKASQAIYHCERYREELAGKFERLELIPLMSPTLRAGGKAVATSVARYIVGWHGLWLPHKGVETLLCAIRQLRDRQIDVGMVAVGGLHDIDEPSYDRSREYWEGCVMLMHDLGLADVVGISNEMASYQDVRATLEQADVIALPYSDTIPGQSSAAATCIVLGKPLILSDMPLFAEYRDEACILPDLTPDTLASILAEILQDAKLREKYREMAQRGALRRSPEAVGKAYREFIERV